MEFIVTTDLSRGALQNIDFNYNELKAELARNLTQYKGMMVGEDDIPTAKKDLAMLRKLNTAMDNERKRIKKAWNEPYAEFEAKVKELQGLVNEPIAEISTQLEAYEERRKDEKMAMLKAYYVEEAGKMAEYLSWEKIRDPRWANITFAEEDAKIAIKGKIDDVYRDLDVIAHTEDFELYTEPVMKKYRDTGDLRETLNYLGHLKAVKREWEKAKEKEAEAASKASEKAADEPTGRVREEEAPIAPKQTGAPMFSISFRATGTKEQLNALAEYMFKNGITYKRIV